MKASLRRLIGAPQAPAELRPRVIAAIDRAQRNEFGSSLRPASSRPALFRSPLFGLAAAALLFLAIGIGVMQNIRSQPKPIVMTMPSQIAEGMVAAHDSAVASITNSPEMTPDQLAEAGSKLRTELNHPIMAPNLGDGWVAKASQVATVFGIPTAQITYARGRNTISVFSVTVKRLYSPPEGATYEMTTGGHAIAGFVRHRTMHCVVGDASMSPAEIKSMADSLAKL